MEEDIYYQEYDLTGVEDIEENIEEVSVQNLYRVEGKVLKQEEIDEILKKELADNKNKQALEIRLSENLSEKFEEVEDKSFELEEDLKKEKIQDTYINTFIRNYAINQDKERNFRKDKDVEVYSSLENKRVKRLMIKYNNSLKEEKMKLEDKKIERVRQFRWNEFKEEDMDFIVRSALKLKREMINIKSGVTEFVYKFDRRKRKDYLNRVLNTMIKVFNKEERLVKIKMEILEYKKVEDKELDMKKELKNLGFIKDHRRISREDISECKKKNPKFKMFSNYLVTKKDLGDFFDLNGNIGFGVENHIIDQNTFAMPYESLEKRIYAIISIIDGVLMPTEEEYDEKEKKAKLIMCKKRKRRKENRRMFKFNENLRVRQVQLQRAVSIHENVIIKEVIDLYDADLGQEVGLDKNEAGRQDVIDLKDNKEEKEGKVSDDKKTEKLKENKEEKEGKKTDTKINIDNRYVKEKSNHGKEKIKNKTKNKMLKKEKKNDLTNSIYTSEETLNFKLERDNNIEMQNEKLGKGEEKKEKRSTKRKKREKREKRERR